MKLDRQMRALASGDMSAFEVIYNETKKSVYYIAYSILCDKSAAEDAMQTTYLKVIKNAASYSYGTSVKAWIAVIAKNKLAAVNKPCNNINILCITAYGNFNRCVQFSIFNFLFIISRRLFVGFFKLCNLLFQCFFIARILFQVVKLLVALFNLLIVRLSGSCRSPISFCTSSSMVRSLTELSSSKTSVPKVFSS